MLRVTDTETGSRVIEMKKIEEILTKLEEFLDRFFGAQIDAFNNIVLKIFKYRFRETEKGIFGLFDSPEKISEAAKATVKKGYTNFDCLTPFPVHGIEFDMGLSRSKVPYITFFGGLTGFLLGFFLQYNAHEQLISTTITHMIDAYPNLNSYPQNFGGKDTYAWPAMIPVLFELTVLMGGLSTVTGMYMLGGIPKPFRKVLHPSITDDKFCLWIPDDSANYNEEEVKAFMEELGAQEITVVKE